MASQSMEIFMFDVQPRIIKETQSLLTNSEWNDALSTLKQQDGVRTAYWGQTVESQDKVYLLIGRLFSPQYNKTRHTADE